MELQDGAAFIGLFMQVRMRWESLASLDALAAAGVDLGGLYVVRREPSPDQRRAVGRIDRLVDGTVHRSESFDDMTTVPINEVWLEGSKASFTRCLKTILKSEYQHFDEEREREEAAFTTGPALEGLLTRMEGFLQQKSPLVLAPDLECTVAGRIRISSTPDYQSVVNAPPGRVLLRRCAHEALPVPVGRHRKIRSIQPRHLCQEVAADPGALPRYGPG